MDRDVNDLKQLCLFIRFVINLHLLDVKRAPTNV